MLSLRFLLAVAVSVAVILSSPFIRDIRDWIRATFPGQYATVVATAVALTIGGAIVVAARSGFAIGELLRYAAIALRAGVRHRLRALERAGHRRSRRRGTRALRRVRRSSRCSSTACGARAATPRCSCCRCWRALPSARSKSGCSGSFPAASATCATSSSTARRSCADCSSASASIRPTPGALTLRPGSLRRIGIVAAAVALLFALFVRSVHLGVETSDPEAGRFRSRYDAATLISIGQERLVLWKDHPADRAAAQPEPRGSVHERGAAARPGAESPLGGGRHSRGVVREPHPREVLRAASSIRRRTSRGPVTGGRRASAPTPSSAWPRSRLARCRTRAALTPPRVGTSSGSGRRLASGSS